MIYVSWMALPFMERQPDTGTKFRWHRNMGAERNRALSRHLLAQLGNCSLMTQYTGARPRGPRMEGQFSARPNQDPL